MEEIKPFDILKSLSKTKNIKWGDFEEKTYVPYLINKGFSYHPDSLLYAEDKNQYPDLDPKLQHDYYFHAILPRARYAKWPKKQVIEDIEVIKKVFSCNDQRAGEYLNIVNEETLNKVKEELLQVK